VLGDGREALCLLHAGSLPSLILLDLLLPVLDGWAFTQEQMLDPALAAIPVVVITAVEGRDPPDAAGHLKKPFSPGQLLDAVRSCLLRHLP
jgi:CheY-like chemotaxis protein